jgi:glycosyltransferase involved in cell wall biosynthesis
MKIMLAYFAQFVNRSGGMEHVCCEFANAMEDRGHHVDIVYASPVEGHPFYPVSDDVYLYNLFHLQSNALFDSGRYLSHSQKIFREIIRVLSNDKAEEWSEHHRNYRYHQLFQQIFVKINPDIIVSFEPRTTAAILYGGKSLRPIITMMHFNPEFILEKATHAEKESIQKSDFVQVLMPSYEKIIKDICPGARVISIPNAVPQYVVHANLKKNKDSYTIINIARFDRKQKQQHLLIQAFSKLAGIFPNWNLELWGDPQNNQEYLKELETLVTTENLENRIFFRGTTDDVISVYMRSDIFCLSSAYEGFPLAMTEAMSAGLPVIGLNTCPAVNEIIKDGENGYLSDPNVNSIAEKLSNLMRNMDKRIAMGESSCVSMKRYSPKSVWNRWENLLIDCVYQSRMKDTFK